MDFKEITRQKLIDSGIEPEEAKVELDILIEHCFGLSKIDIILNRESSFDVSKLDSLIEKRINERIPVQYLINSAFFMGEEFYVDENVLIPRAETEILVEEVVKKSVGHHKIIDIGTGSGCIAIMLAKILENVSIFAVDISRKAIEIAKKNSKKLNVKEKIAFIQSDIMENIDEKFDIIVSNPPYIPLKDKPTLQPEVQKHEPEIALFIDDEHGISFYEKLAGQASRKLNPGGYLIVEIGYFQGDLVKKTFEKNRFSSVQILKDLSGLDRIVSGRLG